MKKTLEAINELKKEGLVKDCAIGGAVAALKWVEPFFTRDLDIFVIPLAEPGGSTVISFLPLYDSLKAKGYDQWTGQWILIEGIPVEFLPAEGLAKEAVEEAVEVEFEGVKTKVMRPEHLIMENDKDLKIMTHDGKVLTLREMYEEHEKTHAEQAVLPFEEKIKILVDLQRLAASWGKKTDVIVWKI